MVESETGVSTAVSGQGMTLVASSFPAKPAFGLRRYRLFPYQIYKGVSAVVELKLGYFGIVRGSKARRDCPGDVRKILFWNRRINRYCVPVSCDGGRDTARSVARSGRWTVVIRAVEPVAVSPRDMHKSKAEFGAAAWRSAALSGQVPTSFRFFLVAFMYSSAYRNSSY